MALTRNYLKSMALTDEQISAIIENHAETVEALKKERDGYKEAAEKASEAAKERDTLRAQLEKAGDAAAVQKEFDAFKAAVAAEKDTAARKAAWRDVLKSGGVQRSEFIDLLEGQTDLKAIEMKDGKITNADALLEPLKAKFAPCFGTSETVGTQMIAPPAGDGKPALTKAEILAIKDTSERQKAIANNLERFQK